MTMGVGVRLISLVGVLGLIAPACAGDDGVDSNGSAGEAGNDTASGGGGAEDAGGGTGGHGESQDCASTNLDRASGIVTCGEIKYRAFRGEGCLYSPGDLEPQGGRAASGEGGATAGCNPAKCNEKPVGYCEAEAPGASGAGPVTCHYGCLTDLDCGANEICLCGDPTDGGRCVSAFCKTDADCSNGARCASSSACNQFSCNEHPVCAVH